MASVTAEERRELTETAAVFEMIAAANAADLSALESLIEIYIKLGDQAKLARARERLGAAPRPAAEAGAGGGEPEAGRESTKDEPKPNRNRLLPLGELLAASGLITSEQLAAALKLQRSSKEKLGSILVRHDFISEDQLLGFLSAQYGLPSMPLTGISIEAEVLRLVPVDLARRYDVLPIKRVGKALTLAMADPVNIEAIDRVTEATGLRVLPVVAGQASLRASITRLYEESADTSAADMLSTLAGNLDAVEVLEDDEAGAKVDVFELKESADEAPVVKLVNMVLADAIQKGGSDVHFEPYEKVYRIRFRIDGVLHEMLAPPKRLEPAITSRLKIMANLDIAERRLPQDGRIKLRYNTREIDFRVSILPTIYGEKAVLRILDKEALRLDLGQLGFDPWSLEQFPEAIHQPYGMVLITGPTGSGKTTTLYSAHSHHQLPRAQHHDGRGPRGVQPQGRQPGADQRGRGAHLRRRAALVPAPGPRRDPGGRDAGSGDGPDRHPGRAHRPSGLFHPAHQRLRLHHRPAGGHGHPALLVASSLVLILAQRLGRASARTARRPWPSTKPPWCPTATSPRASAR